jgi:hypothetical protein
MPVELLHDRDNIYRLEIGGVLRRAELTRCEAELTAEMRRRGTVRLLCVLSGFEGWEPGPGWNDLGFYVKHGDAIERIAIVGAERWRTEAMMFAAADLRRAPVEYFTEGQVAAAQAWLSA